MLRSAARLFFPIRRRISGGSGAGEFGEPLSFLLRSGGGKLGGVFAFKPHPYLNRTAADLTVLDKILRPSPARVQADAQRNAAVRAGKRMVLFNHGAPLSHLRIFPSNPVS